MPEQRYRVRFTAVVEGPFPPDAATRLRDSLEAMPGVPAIDPPTAHERARRVTAGFALADALDMADAARDASRLAREALHGAGMESAQLVELVLRLDGPTPGDA